MNNHICVHTHAVHTHTRFVCTCVYYLSLARALSFSCSCSSAPSRAFTLSSSCIYYLRLSPQFSFAGRSDDGNAKGAERTEEHQQKKKRFPNRKLTELAPSSEEEDSVDEAVDELEQRERARGRASDIASRMGMDGSGDGGSRWERSRGGESERGGDEVGMPDLVLHAFTYRCGTKEIFETFCAQSETATVRGQARRTMNLREFLSVLCVLMHCDTLQHTATHCNTLQHTATHRNTHMHNMNLCDFLSVLYALQYCATCRTMCVCASV